MKKSFYKILKTLAKIQKNYFINFFKFDQILKTF